MSTNTPQTVETATTKPACSALVGAWSVKAVVTSEGPFPPPGFAIWGLIAFNSDGIATPFTTSSGFGSAGGGVWEPLHDTPNSVTFSFMEHFTQNGEWKGTNYIHAPEVVVAEDGSTLFAPHVQVMMRDPQGNISGEFTTSLEGTRIMLVPPREMPKQIM